VFFAVKIASCTASSDYNGQDPCGNAYDGSMRSDWGTAGEGTGSWIKLQFAGAQAIAAMNFANRPFSSALSKGLKLEFSDRSTRVVALQQNSASQRFALAPAVTTTFVKIVVTSVYTSSNNGATEISFEGLPGTCVPSARSAESPPPTHTHTHTLD